MVVFIVHSVIDIIVNLERQVIPLHLYGLADKNAGGKKDTHNKEGARITKRFGTTDQGKLPWFSGEKDALCLRADPQSLKAE